METSAIMICHRDRLCPQTFVKKFNTLLSKIPDWGNFGIEKYAGTGENCNIAIPVIFYPLIKSFGKLLCLLFECINTQILNLRAGNNFANMLEIVQKSDNLRDLWTIFNIFAK